MMFTKYGSIPHHKYILVDSSFTHESPIGWQEAMWVGVTSIPGRAWGLNVVFRLGGMLYRNVPPHAVAFAPEPESLWCVDNAQAWNCYSDHFVVYDDPVLAGMRLNAKTSAGTQPGEFMFATGHMRDGWSEAPEQDKMFMWCRLDNGRLTIQPNNHVTFFDSSFIINSQPKPRLLLQETFAQVDEKQNYKYDF